MNKTQEIKLKYLKDRLFDKSYFDEETKKFVIWCSGCSAFGIMGTPHHEKNCKNWRND